jgi:hypothetical protein
LTGVITVKNRVISTKIAACETVDIKIERLTDFNKNRPKTTKQQLKAMAELL